ncbi:hypothetical protein [uncultured Bacteroides sp.]|uniref:hypothetical protein n=1 Tax=uncultured Bacteroides sp. TaxID=162156 RepID=UPI002AABE7BA|nr:hypothetical protein [uncultured Bacteroides sp.]
MEILSSAIYDKKIQSYNVIMEMSLIEYYEFIKSSMLDNEFQRNKVRSSKTIYALLKQDLIAGCVIPPIVLAMNIGIEKEKREDLQYVKKIIEENKDNIFILDGLQRTFTIQDICIDAEKEYIDKSALNNPIRVEIYLGLNKEGVLYRMLTLNTGQTPMNLRHQIEIIYSDLINAQNTSDFSLVKDTESANLNKIGFYKFSDAIDSFTSFLENDYLQITREKLLSTIKSFDNLSKLRNETDLFGDLISTYTLFLRQVVNAIGVKDIVSDIPLGTKDNLFGKDAFTIFNKSQPLTGFGAAISRLIELDAFMNVKDLKNNISSLDLDDLYEGILNLLIELNDIRISSKKIGNAQRCFFYHFFRIYFDKRGDYFLSAVTSVKQAKQAYDRDN